MIRSLLLSCAVSFAAILPAAAQTIGDAVSAAFLTGWREADGRHMAAVRISLAPGWKTYWRAPGDAGIPPRFDWSGSSGVATVTPHWPVPEVFHQNGLRSVGYGDVVTVPLEVRGTGSGPMRLEGRMDIGVCQDICIPASFTFAADLPGGQGTGAAAIRAALADRPMTKSEAGVGKVTCRAEPISDGMQVTVEISMPRMARDEAAVVEFADPSVWVSEPKIERRGGQLRAVADMVPSHAGPFAVSRNDVRITVLGGGDAVDIRGCTGS